jgi:lipoate-protein ligase A
MEIVVVKTIKFEDEMVESIENVIKKLNEKTGVNLYDFSNIVRLAVKQYLDSDAIKEMLQPENDLLLVSETSLSKDWLRQEEDEAWKNL